MCKYDIQEQVKILKNNYKQIKIEPRNVSSKMVSDCIMSGIALFSLKYPSLLQFDQAKENSIISHNLGSARISFLLI